jgi:tetratricopeptide (TPR) repeat protein/Zn-dependent protease
MDFSFTHTLIYIFGIALVLILAVIGASINQLLGIRIHRPRLQLADHTDVPDYLQRLYEDAAAQLAKLGFEIHHYQLTSDIIAHERAEKLSLVMVNRESKVFAEISPATTFLDLPGYETDFWSIASDGSALATINGRGHTVLSNIPGAEIHDPMAASLTEQYETHLVEQKDVFATKILATPNTAGYLKLQQKLLDGYFVGLLKEGGLISTGNNEFRLTFRKTISLMRQLIRGEKRLQSVMRKKLTAQAAIKNTDTSSEINPSPEYSIEAEVQAYLRLQSARQRNSAGMMSKIVTFIVTLALSYIAFGLVFSFNSVVILLGVILFHELGHIAAMYAFKYRDLQILFIPLLGAAATGKKDDVAVWKQVIVYLMGPLPGILTGIGLIMLHQSYQAAWLYETAIIMLVINYINLLPFVPLDGGHIVRLTIMERFPTGKLFFSGLSGVAFAAGGWFLGEPVFWVLSVLMLTTLPMAALEAGVLHELYLPPFGIDDLPKERKLKRIFETLKQSKFKKMHFADKFKLVNSLSDVVFQTRHLGRAGSLGLASLYIGALLLTPPAIIVSAAGWENTYNAIAILGGQIPKKDWDKDIANAETSEQRFELILSAAQFYSATNELPKALTYLEQAEKTLAAVESDTTLARLYEAYWIYYQRLSNVELSISYLEKAIDVRKKSAEQNYPQLSSNYQALANLYQQQNKLEVMKSNLMTALDYAMKINTPEDRFMISNVVNQLLSVHYRQQNPDAAQALLLKILPELIEYTDPLNSYVLSFIYQELGWLYAEKGKLKSAIKQFNYALTVLQDSAQFSAVDQPGYESSDPFAVINVYLAIAVNQFDQGNLTVAKGNFEKAEKIAKENYFESLEQYISDYLPENIPVDQEVVRSRDSVRWNLINETYRKINTLDS